MVGDEGSISIAIDLGQRSISVLSESGRCNQTTPIWGVIVGIILGIIFIGLVVVVLWRSCAYLAVSAVLPCSTLASVLKCKFMLAKGGGGWGGGGAL